MNNLLKEIKHLIIFKIGQRISQKLRIYCFISKCNDWFHIDHFYVFWLEPISINETKEHLAMYYVGEDSANGKEFERMRKENARFWKDVMSEDINAIEGMQEGRNSPVYNGGNFSPVMDNPTHQFHKWVADNLI